MTRPPPTSTLFPYTTLFRSLEDLEAGRPASFSRTLTALERNTGQLSGAISIGDSYRHSPDLQFQFGLRLEDRKSTRLNSSHSQTSYAVFCLKKKTSHHNERD